MFIKHSLMTFELIPSAAFITSWNLNLVQNQSSQIQPTSTDILPGVNIKNHTIKADIFRVFCRVSCISTATQVILSPAPGEHADAPGLDGKCSPCSRSWICPDMNAAPPQVAADTLIKSLKLLHRLLFDVEQQQICSELLGGVNCLHG